MIWWVLRGALILLGVAFFAGAVFVMTASVPPVGQPDYVIAPVTQREFLPRPTGTSIPEPEAPLRHFVVTYVHGISCHSADYSAPFQFRFAKALGFVPLNADRVTGTGSIEWYELSGRTVAARGQERDYLKTSDFGSADLSISATEVRAAFTTALKRKSLPRRFLDQCRPAAVDPSGEKAASAKATPSPSATAAPPPAQIHVRKFIHPKSRERLSFVEVLWSPLSEDNKRRFLAFDAATGTEAQRVFRIWRPLMSHRVYGEAAAANRFLKDTIVNGAFSDAVFYLGDGGPAVRDAVLAGLDISVGLAKQADEHVPLRPKYILVTESLGSRIVFDTIRAAPDLYWQSFEDVVALIRSQPTFIMFANQLPLFEMVNTTENAILAYADPSKAPAFAQLAIDRRMANRMLNDPSIERLLPGAGEGLQSCLAKFDSVVRLQKTSPSLSQAYDRQLFLVQDPAAVALIRIVNDNNVELTKTGSNNPVVRKWDGAIAEVTAHNEFLRLNRGGPGYGRCRSFIESAKAQLRNLQLMKPDETKSAKAVLADIATLTRLIQVGGGLSQAEIYNIDPLGNVIALLRSERIMQMLEAHRATCETDSVQVPEHCRFEELLQKFAFVNSDDDIRAVVFSDPNDLLSYRVLRGESSSANTNAFRFTNVPVRLTPPVLPLEGWMGAAAHPLDAHTLHKFDNTVLTYLVCGWDIEKRRSLAKLNDKPCPLQLPTSPQAATPEPLQKPGNEPATRPQ